MKPFRCSSPRAGVGTEGDAFFVAFVRASQAVAAAVAGQRALATHSWPDGVDLRVRTEIHTVSRSWLATTVPGWTCTGSAVVLGVQVLEPLDVAGFQPAVLGSL